MFNFNQIFFARKKSSSNFHLFLNIIKSVFKSSINANDSCKFCGNLTKLTAVTRLQFITIIGKHKVCFGFLIKQHIIIINN